MSIVLYIRMLGICLLFCNRCQQFELCRRHQRSHGTLNKIDRAEERNYGHAPPDDPQAYRQWLTQLEQKWLAGEIPDPQAVAIILVNPRGEVLLQLRDNNPKISSPNTWTLPGGVVEVPETLEQAARRELAEETGLCVELSHWKVYKRKPGSYRFEIEQHVFTGETRQEVDEMTLGEGQALRFFRRDELPSIPIGFGFDDLLDEYFRKRL